MAIGKKQRKLLFTALKLVIGFVLIYFVFTKINPEDVADILAKAHWGLLFLAVFLVGASKALAALRLEGYLHQIGAPISRLENLKLYLLGMFYNLFIPGGIGGDAYKGYVIQKTYPVKTKQVVSALLLDRLSGMLLLFLYGCIIALILPADIWQGWSWLFWLGMPSSVVVFWYLNKRFFAFVLPFFWQSALYSAGVQGLQLLAVECILYAFGIETQHLSYLLVFLASSIASALPISPPGGLGFREATFYYGHLWLALSKEQAVSISLTFFLSQALISLFGMYYHFKKPMPIPSDEELPSS